MGKTKIDKRDKQAKTIIHKNTGNEYPITPIKNIKENENCENFDDGLTRVAPKGEFHSNKPVIQNDITKENEIEKGIDIRYCEECHTLQKLDPDRNSPYHNVCFNCNMKKAILRSY